MRLPVDAGDRSSPRGGRRRERAAGGGAAHERRRQHPRRGCDPVVPGDVALGLAARPGREDRVGGLLRRRDHPAGRKLGTQLTLGEALGGDESGQHEANVNAVRKLLSVKRVAPAGERKLARGVGTCSRSETRPAVLATLTIETGAAYGSAAPS